MTISAEALRELHRIHRQLTDLRDRLQRGPKQICAGEVSVQGLDEQLAAAKEKHKRARMSSDDKQLQLKSRSDRIVDLKNKLNTANSNKEYQALKEQIAADEQASSVLEDEILELLEKIDELYAIVVEAEGKLSQTKDEVEKTRTRVQKEQIELEAELGRVTTERERAESALPVDFKAEYDRMTRARGENALAAVESETCTGCFKLLSPQMMNELMLSKPVFCKSCGALLYLPEDP